MPLPKEGDSQKQQEKLIIEEDDEFEDFETGFPFSLLILTLNKHFAVNKFILSTTTLQYRWNFVHSQTLSKPYFSAMNEISLIYI